MSRDEPIRRYSKKPNPYLIPLVGSGVAGVLLLCIGLLVWAVWPRGQNVTSGGGSIFPVGVPTADKEGLNWSVKELADHLRASGVVSEYEIQEPKKTAFGESKPTILVRTAGGGKVTIEKHNGAISAEDYIGTIAGIRRSSPDAVTHRWGAFTLVGSEADRDDTTAVAAALRGAKMYRGRTEVSGRR